MRKDGDFYPLFGEEAFHEARCPHCGGAVELDPDGKHARCLYCKESFSIAGADLGGRWGQKLQEAISDRNNYDFWLAEGTIENELPDLRDAIKGSEGEKRKRLRLLLSRFLYQLALCQYCVSHVDAGSIVEGKEVERLEIPTLATKATRPFRENLSFKEAVGIAEEEGDGQLKEFYLHEAQILDGLVREGEEVASRPGTRFDVFISYKADPENAEGQQIARAIFERLRAKGYSVFWSDPSAKLQRGGESFNAFIFQALFSARAFILVCTGKPGWYSGREGRWIYNEWRRFLHRREVEKDPSLLLIPVLGKGFGVEDLHVRLRQAIQAIRTEGNAGWLESVVSSVESLDWGRMPRKEVRRLSLGEEKAMDVISISSGKKFELGEREAEDERERNAVDRARTNLELAERQEKGSSSWRRYVESARSALLHISSGKKLSLEGSELLFRSEYLLSGWSKETVEYFDWMARLAYTESGGKTAKGTPYGLLLEETLGYFEPRKVNRDAGIHLGIPVEKDLSWVDEIRFLDYIGTMPGMVPEDERKYREGLYFKCAEATWARLMAYPLPKDTEKVKSLLRVIYPHLTHLDRAEVVRRIDGIAMRLLEESRGIPSRKRLAGELSALILKGEGFLGDRVPVRKNDPDALWIYHFSHSFISRPNFLNEKDMIPLFSKMVEGGYLLCEGGARNRLQQAFDALSVAVVRSPFLRKKAVRCFLRLGEIVPYASDWDGLGSYAFLERAFDFAGHLIAKRAFAEAGQVLRFLPRKVALTTSDKSRLSCLLLLANAKCNCYEALVKVKKDLSSDEACSIGGEGNALLLYEKVERAKSSKARLKYLRKIASIYSKRAYKTGSFRPMKEALEVFDLPEDGLKARLSYLKEGGRDVERSRKSSERKNARAARRKSKKSRRILREMDEAAVVEAPITRGDRLATFAQSGSAVAAGLLSLIGSLLLYFFLKRAPGNEVLELVGIFFYVSFALSFLILFLGLNSWKAKKRRFLNFLLAALLTAGPCLLALLFVYPTCLAGSQYWARPLLATCLASTFAIYGYLSLAAPGRSRGIKFAFFIPFLLIAVLSLLVPVFLPLGLLG